MSGRKIGTHGLRYSYAIHLLINNIQRVRPLIYNELQSDLIDGRETVPSTLRLPDGFYSDSPKRRVAALGETTEDMREALLSQVPEWPTMSPGSLNAWLVFLGPSPGNSPGKPWNYDPDPSIGHAHPGVAKYVDRKGFWNGIRGYAGAVFFDLEPSDACAATMVRNLDPTQSATTSRDWRMYIAARDVVEVLGKIIRPRLVIAIGGSREYTDKAFNELFSISKHEDGTLYSARARDARRWHSLSGFWNDGEPFLYVSPSGIHPSRRQVSREDSLAFLREQSDEARSLTQ